MSVHGARRQGMGADRDDDPEIVLPAGMELVVPPAATTQRTSPRAGSGEPERPDARAVGPRVPADRVVPRRPPAG
jgi:hypothetical protein